MKKSKAMCNICFKRNLGYGKAGKWKCLKCMNCGQVIVVYRKDDLNRNWDIKDE